MTASEAVAFNVRKLRKANGWRLVDLVDRIEPYGFDRGFAMLSRMERGECRITVDDLAAFCAVFDVSPASLMDFADAEAVAWAEIEEMVSGCASTFGRRERRAAR